MKSLKYSDAGVDLGKWEQTKNKIGNLVKSTYNRSVVGDFGQFGGLFDISAAKNFNRPVLVSSVDGVGTKLKIAFETGIHDTVGQDIVNHCIDDILVMGASPLYFLDYIGTGKLSPDITEQIIVGLTIACKAADIALIGGETAEMPGFYGMGEYDIAGTIVGIVDYDRIIDGSTISPGDTIIGLKSNGLHTNGYSLARKIVTEVAQKKYSDIFSDTGMSFGQELLRPHRSYLPILPVLQRGGIKGCAHITGGGFYDNINRVLPKNTSAIINASSWIPDPIFLFLQSIGNVELSEMYHTFNMGIGMVIVCNDEDIESVVASPEFSAFNPVIIGHIEHGNGTVEITF